MPNTVYVATSLDGYIADRDGGLGWLESTPHPAGDDLGFAAFMEGIDALVMGRITFETVYNSGSGPVQQLSQPRVRTRSSRSQRAAWGAASRSGSDAKIRRVCAPHARTAICAAHGSAGRTLRRVACLVRLRFDRSTAR